MKTRGHQSRSAPAFTLIEIMMVIAIIALTLTMGFPSFKQALQREGMNKVVNGLVEACQSARRAAIMNNQPAFVDIRSEDRVISVSGASEFTPVQIPEDIVIEKLGVNFVEPHPGENARVSFLANGTSDEFVILLHGPDGTYRTIYLDCVTALSIVENRAMNPYEH